MQNLNPLPRRRERDRERIRECDLDAGSSCSSRTFIEQRLGAYMLQIIPPARVVMFGKYTPAVRLGRSISLLRLLLRQAVKTRNLP